MVFEEHDYKKYPELTDRQLRELRLDSPHQQIESDFMAKVVKVHDGDTIILRADFRNFDFPLRFLEINAPELKKGGEEARDWLRDRILNSDVQIRINPKNRVDKWGRLLGHVFHHGLDVGTEMLHRGLAVAI